MKGTASNVIKADCVMRVARASARITTSACESWKNTFKWRKKILPFRHGNVRGAFMPSAMKLRMISV